LEPRADKDLLGELAEGDDPPHARKSAGLKSGDITGSEERGKTRAPIAAVNKSAIGRAAQAAFTGLTLSKEQGVGTAQAIVMEGLYCRDPRLSGGLIDRGAQEWKDVMKMHQIWTPSP